eukprot:scaffold285580_cov15-Tisochrysis_lutea.AAC.1
MRYCFKSINASSRAHKHPRHAKTFKKIAALSIPTPTPTTPITDLDEAVLHLTRVGILQTNDTHPARKGKHKLGCWYVKAIIHTTCSACVCAPFGLSSSRRQFMLHKDHRHDSEGFGKGHDPWEGKKLKFAEDKRV